MMDGFSLLFRTPGPNPIVLSMCNGTYLICDTIRLDQKQETLSIVGESKERTILRVIPGGDAGPVFNVDRAGGFDHLNVAIKNLTITYGQRGRISTGHGIRVGNGWRSGSLLIENVAILYAPGYGIGIQNHKDGDFPASNVTIRDVYIAHAGSDGIDTKRSPAGNSNLLIENIVIRNIGLNDARSAAALDISYNQFILRNVSIMAQSCIETNAAYERVGRECTLAKADPTRTKDEVIAVCSQKPVSCNVGIHFRERANGSASFGLAENIYIRGVSHGIFFAGKAKPNKHITVNQFVIKDFTRSGLYLRGAFNEVTNGCAIDPTDSFAVGREIHLGSPLDRASTTVEWATVGSKESFCPLDY